jgi:hypothetical protein
MTPTTRVMTIGDGARRRRLAGVGKLPALVTALLTATLLGACGDDPQSPTSKRTTTVEGSDRFDLPQGGEVVELDPAEFTAEIDNPYWPMDPGTRWTYREIDEEGKELKAVVIVTTETKEIANGISARVVRDTVTEDGELIEDTKDWYAQDAEGNIWYVGEETAEFEDGELTTRSGSFEAGVDGALPGIIMPADPQPGMMYRQEYYEGEAEDNGEVLSTNEMAEVPFGQFKNVLLTKDTITIEPDVLEYKLYAKGVGPVLVFGVSGGGGREELLKMDRVPETAGLGPLGSPHP